MLLDKYNSMKLYSTGNYDYIVNYSNDRYIVTLNYVSNNNVKSVVINHIDTEHQKSPIDEGDKFLESLKKDLTKRGIEFKINGNIINIENII